ncbi:MAG: FtsX-like permease family protein [Micromonosporaceae bacterium]|nr:FtsX-like permease family protein [Micromonosporaceae bacterium]
MRLVLARAAAARTLLVAAAVAATVTAVLVTAFALYAQLLPVAGTRAAILAADPAERSLLVRSGAGDSAQDLTARDAAVRELLGRELAGARLAVLAGGSASGQELPPGLAPREGAAVVGFLTDLPEHAELVAGAWPEPVAGDAPVEAVLPAPVAAELGLAVGDQVDIVDARTERRPAPVLVVGTWRPIDPADLHWRLLAGPLDRGGWGPFVVHPDEFAGRYRLLASLEWVAVPDPARMSEAGMSAVAADVEALSEELVARQEAGDPTLDGSVRLTTDLEPLADRLAVAMVVNRSGMVLPATLLVVIAGFGLVLVARLLAAHRQGENALLRARGASRRQLVRFTAAEALLVATPAALLSAPAATALVRFADQRAGDRTLSITGDLAGYGLLGPPLAWLVAVAAGAGCAVALALPVGRRGRTWVAEQQERSRPGRAAALQRAGVDVALVALAVLAWVQLRQYGSAVTPTDAGFGVDPLLVAAPVVGVLAATAVALRLLPLATRVGVRLAARRDAFPGLLGMWQADRRPHAGPVLLLVLAVGTAVLAPAVATTWQRSQRDQAAQQVGADLRITVENPSAASPSQVRATLPGATGLMPVHRGELRVADAVPTTLLALDSAQAPAVARLRPDLAPAGPEDLFAMLRQGRPELFGLPLPEGTRGVAGRFRFTVPEPATYRFQRVEFDPLERDPVPVPVQVELPRPNPDRLSVHVRDADGLVQSVEFGQLVADERGNLVAGGGIEPDDGDRLDFDVDLPVGATELVGLGGGLTVAGWGVDVFPDDEADPVPVRWEWEDLRAVDADGVETPLGLPDSWQVHGRGGDGEQAGPQPRRVDRQPAATATLDPFRDYPMSLQFRITAPAPPLSQLPVVVTPDVLAATGNQVGQSFAVEDGPDGIGAARLAGVVAVMPGTVDGSGAMVDLAWLSTQQFLSGQQPPLVTEWWAATPDGPATAGLADLGWASELRDRRVEAGQRLGDPLGSGVLVSLWAAAATGALLTAFGLVVDSRATAVRRRRELAVLHTLGTSPAGLARALVVEQAVLAGLGVAAGVLVGVGVTAAMGTSLVLTAAGAVPVPAPLLTLSPAQFAAPTLGLFAVAIGLGALVARRARREVAAGALRIGEDG